MSLPLFETLTTLVFCCPCIEYARNDSLRGVAMEGRIVKKMRTVLTVYDIFQV